MPRLLPLLDSGSIRVLARAAGALHNVSSAADAIHVIRKNDGLPRLARLLKYGDAEVAAAAAGAV